MPDLMSLLSGMPNGPAAFLEPPRDPRYDTPLSPAEMARYHQRAEQLRPTLGRDIRQDERDYDMRGAFGAGLLNQAGPGHFPDQFKKPWHPTFSTESQYSLAPGMKPGIWSQGPKGEDVFTAGRTNLEYQNPNQMRDYFRRVEPAATLKIPTMKLPPNPFDFSSQPPGGWE